MSCCLIDWLIGRCSTLAVFRSLYRGVRILLLFETHFLVANLIEKILFLFTQNYCILENSKPFANQVSCVIFQEDAGFQIHTFVCTCILKKVQSVTCDNPGRWFSPGTPVSSTNKTDYHDITEILLKVALNTIKPNHQSKKCTVTPINFFKQKYMPYIFYLSKVKIKDVSIYPKIKTRKYHCVLSHR